MKTKDLSYCIDTLTDALEFIENNADGDESGILDSLQQQISHSIKILSDASYKIYLKNALIKARAKSK